MTPNLLLSYYIREVFPQKRYLELKLEEGRRAHKTENLKKVNISEEEPSLSHVGVTPKVTRAPRG